MKRKTTLAKAENHKINWKNGKNFFKKQIGKYRKNLYYNIA